MADACTLGELVELACLWEVGVPKPGNVHPQANFSDTTYDDFVRSAQALRLVFDRCAIVPLGQLIHQAVQATRLAVGQNTNLGIILAIAPLAVATSEQEIDSILRGLTIDDAAEVYAAIRLAQPGGLGTVKEHDVQTQPTITLLQAMQAAASHDLIARQYANGFADVLGFVVPGLVQALHAQFPGEPYHQFNWWQSTWLSHTAAWQKASNAIQHTFLHGLATLGDTLIARKCGPAIMQEAQQRAQRVLQTADVNNLADSPAYRDLDTWLRADGHRRNPGTMADLIAASLFVVIRRTTTL